MEEKEPMRCPACGNFKIRITQIRSYIPFSQPPQFGTQGNPIPPEQLYKIYDYECLTCGYTW